MKAPYGTTAVSLTVFMAFAFLSGCAGYGSGESVPTDPSHSPSSTGETPGQQMFRDQSQKRQTMEGTTQTPDVPLPDSASPTPCKGYPGFDRGCPESAK